jgi:hypothetical protein
MTTKLRFILLMMLLVSGLKGVALGDSLSSTSSRPSYTEPLRKSEIAHLRVIFKQLIDVENKHDIKAVKPFLWNSPSALFVAKTATPEEGVWAGFWGSGVVLKHFADLYQGTFHMEPDYTKQKIVGLTADIAEIYTPFKIDVSYAGQTPLPKPFLVVIDWTRTPDGWRLASDIAIPVPSPVKEQSN